MDCTLMHKNTPVVDAVIDDVRGTIVKIGKLHNPEHLPIGTAGIGAKKNQPDINFLDDWWIGRSIPASRDNIKSALHTLRIQSTSELITKCYGLSLSDQYWICPKNSGLVWSGVNFFENDFSMDIGEILFGHMPENIKKIDMLSPDNTSDGWLQKKWIISGGKRCLMKGSGSGFEQEPFNEVIAAAVMRRLNIPHVPYTLTFNEGKPYSVCENFVTPETELIPAWRVNIARNRVGGDSDLSHLLRSCDSLGIPDVRIGIDKMLTVDYIIENEDRHYNNFGFLRNADTLEWLGFAPVYDSGTSLWHNDPGIGLPKTSRPFKRTHAEQIELVDNLEWFNLDALEGIKDECEKIFAGSNLNSPKHPAHAHIAGRWTGIADAVWERAVQIERAQKNKR